MIRFGRWVAAAWILAWTVVGLTGAQALAVESGPPASIYRTNASLSIVLQRYHQAIGEAKSASRIERWTVTFGGATGTCTVTVSGDDVRREYTLGPLQSASGTVGGVHWVQNENGDPENLAMPASRPLFDAGPDPVKLPARIVDDRIIVTVRIKNRSVNLVLDSGSSDIVIDDRVLSELGVKTVGKWTGAVAGPFLASRAVVNELSIGDLHLPRVVVSSLPLADVESDGTVIGGLLGFDFFAGCVVHVDYEHGTVEVIDPSAFAPPRGAAALHVAFDDAVPSFTAAIGNAPAGRMVLDTGADRSVLFSTFEREHAGETTEQGLGQEIIASFPFEQRFSGVGGKIAVRPKQVSTLSIAGLTLPLCLFYVTRNAPDFEIEDEDGLIGQDFLRNFDVYFDDSRGLVYLQPNARFRARWPVPAALGTGSGS